MKKFISIVLALVMILSTSALAFAAVAVFMTACASVQTGEKASPDALKIGWAKRSIAKDGPVPITGQFYLRISQGQYSPVLTSALAVSTEKDSVIFVSVDITAPLYWWKEFDTYKVGTTANSCSTMHKIHAKEFSLDDFSHENMISNMGETFEALDALCLIIDLLNQYRNSYNETKEKRYWYSMIQLLPSSYNQMRTVTLTYENLINIYHARRHHKLTEWHILCDLIETLPYAKELICGDGE